MKEKTVKLLFKDTMDNVGDIEFDIFIHEDAYLGVVVEKNYLVGSSDLMEIIINPEDARSLAKEIIAYADEFFPEEQRLTSGFVTVSPGRSIELSNNYDDGISCLDADIVTR